MRILDGLLCVHHNSIHLHDYAFLRKYRDDYYIITLHRMYRLSGYEAVNSKKTRYNGKRIDKEDDERFASSISKTKALIFELALCNEWTSFVHMTFDKTKHDRFDLHGIYGKISKFINNYDRLHQIKLGYLLVPEKHDDGAWHIHGLIMGLPDDHLTKVTGTGNAFKHKNKTYDWVISARKYDWPAFAKSFGFIRLADILDIERVANYLRKEITTEKLKNAAKAKNRKSFYSSESLKRAEVIHRGYLIKELDKIDYENEFVKIQKFSDLDVAMDYFEQT